MVSVPSCQQGQKAIEEHQDTMDGTVSENNRYASHHPRDILYVVKPKQWIISLSRSSTNEESAHGKNEKRTTVLYSTEKVDLCD